MSEPEISRHCPWCGVSLREQAFFCPQCGKSLGGEPAVAEGEAFPTQPLIHPTSPLSENGENLTERRDVAGSSVDPDQSSVTQRLSNNSRKSKGKKTSALTQKPAVDRTNKPAEASNAATEVRGPVKNKASSRVEKLRNVSSVVLSEATYDPSIRFLLVAAVLFVLFLLVVILNKVLG